VAGEGVVERDDNTNLSNKEGDMVFKNLGTKNLHGVPVGLVGQNFLGEWKKGKISAPFTAT